LIIYAALEVMKLSFAVLYVSLNDSFLHMYLQFFNINPRLRYKYIRFWKQAAATSNPTPDFDFGLIVIDASDVASASKIPFKSH